MISSLLRMGYDHQQDAVFFGQEADEAFKSSRVHAEYHDIPRVEAEGTLAKAYITHRNRVILATSSSGPVTQVYLLAMNKKDAQVLKTSYKEPVEERKET